MKIIQSNLKSLSTILAIIQPKYYSTTGDFPYTSELYKKNYIRYPVQSKSAISHDYIYHGDERLPSYKERMEEFKDPIENLKKYIGKATAFKSLEDFKDRAIKKIQDSKNNKELELKSRELQINVPIEEIEEGTKIVGKFKVIQKIADHYNINKDLFEQAYFRPVLDLKVEYINESEKHNVYYGNRLSAKCTTNKPVLKWNDLLNNSQQKNEQSVYHSLLFLNLDGNFQNSKNDVLLWFLANVKNGDISTGHELVDYVQPFPMRGSGWHRCVYLLFEHQNSIDFNLSNNEATTFISKRNFKTSSFYLKHQENITPVGLAFFQTEWDLSVRNFFHNHMKMKEPVYDFDYGKRFVPKFEKYPRDQPFNWYLQEYKDKKQMNEEVMKDYLKNISPFEPYPEPAKYPLLDLDKVRPRWYKYELQSYRKRKHQYSMIPYKYFNENIKVEETIKNLPFQQK